MEQYYYNRMNKIEQAVYHALYQGFLNISEEANNVIVHMVIPLANFAKNR